MQNITCKYYLLSLQLIFTTLTQSTIAGFGFPTLNFGNIDFDLSSPTVPAFLNEVVEPDLFTHQGNKCTDKNKLFLKVFCFLNEQDKELYKNYRKKYVNEYIKQCNIYKIKASVIADNGDEEGSKIINKVDKKTEDVLLHMIYTNLPTIENEQTKRKLSEIFDRGCLEESSNEEFKFGYKFTKQIQTRILLQTRQPIKAAKFVISHIIWDQFLAPKEESVDFKEESPTLNNVEH